MTVLLQADSRAKLVKRMKNGDAHSVRFHLGVSSANEHDQERTKLMRYVLCWMVMQFLQPSVAQAQVPNDATGVPQVFEFPLPHQTVVLEFNQDVCQTSVTEEYVIPNVPANPGNGALTMLFNAECDLGLSPADTVPMAVMGPSTAGTVTMAHRPQREIIEEFLISPDGLRTVVKFGK